MSNSSFTNKYLINQLQTTVGRLTNLIAFTKEQDIEKKERLTNNLNLAKELIEKLENEEYVINNNELAFINCEYIHTALEIKARKIKEIKKNNFSKKGSFQKKDYNNQKSYNGAYVPKYNNTYSNLRDSNNSKIIIRKKDNTDEEY